MELLREPEVWAWMCRRFPWIEGERGDIGEGLVHLDFAALRRGVERAADSNDAGAARAVLVFIEELVGKLDLLHPDVVNALDVSFLSVGPGARAVLPLLSSGPVALPVLSAVRAIAPRSTITITYDGDDHRATNLVVEGRRGGPRWLALEDCSTELPLEMHTRWVIKSVSALPEAPSDMLEAARAASRRGLWLFVAHFGFLLPVGLWFASRRAARAPEGAVA